MDSLYFNTVLVNVKIRLNQPSSPHFKLSVYGNSYGSTSTMNKGINIVDTSAHLNTDSSFHSDHVALCIVSAPPPPGFNSSPVLMLKTM